MEIKINKGGAVMTVFAEGDIDHHNADSLREKVDAAFERSACKHMIFDFSRVSFMDSSGIGLIIGRYKNTEKRGGKLIITSANENTRRIIQISGLQKIVRCHDTVSDAMKALGVE
ncbi:MAG: anti-sigma factor antagonist [Clostridiales bacterium]|jgi:stage II sporulation protein AA (anti-sigma F factor antagonist)|nr:anti-sigma factor antagonist [Clostridiales bacterium]